MKSLFLPKCLLCGEVSPEAFCGSCGAAKPEVLVFNATPHTIRFWDPMWPEPIEVEPDELINAHPEETEAGTMPGARWVRFVRTEFVGGNGRAVIERIKRDHPAALIVGSIIAAQTYPGDVVSMCPSPGYERVAPDEKRMLPDKFNIFA